MEIKIDQTKWWQRIYASLIFFTRLPFWRIYQPPQQCYETVVEHWPFAGWLTGGVMAAVVYFGSMLFTVYTNTHAGMRVCGHGYNIFIPMRKNLSG